MDEADADHVAGSDACAGGQKGDDVVGEGVVGAFGTFWVSICIANAKKGGR